MTPRRNADDDSRDRGERTYGFGGELHYADCPRLLSSSGQSRTLGVCDCEPQHGAPVPDDHVPAQ